MIYWELFRIFSLIGFFCFGGGYAILPFIQDEVVGHGWLTLHEFGDIIAVAESTPGPVSINTATFVGYKMAGLGGAICATFSLCLPSFILATTVVNLLYTNRGARILDRILLGIRPVVVGMICFAAWSIGKTDFFQSITSVDVSFNYMAAFISVVVFILSVQFKINPIKIIIGSCCLGLLLSTL